VLIVYAKTNPSAEKPQHGISAFLIEKVSVIDICMWACFYKFLLSYSMLDICTFLPIIRCLLCTCLSYYVLIVLCFVHWQCWLATWPITICLDPLRELPNLGNLTCWCAIKKLLTHSVTRSSYVNQENGC